MESTVVVPPELLFPGGPSGLPKLILGWTGVISPFPPFDVDEELDWEEGRLWEGDSFLFSPDYGELIKDLLSRGIEVFFLSGLGSTAVDIASAVFGIGPKLGSNLSWITTFSEEELGIGDSAIQSTAITAKAISLLTDAKCIWVDVDAHLVDETETFKTCTTDINAGMTLDQLREIYFYLKDDTVEDD